MRLTLALLFTSLAASVIALPSATGSTLLGASDIYAVTAIGPPGQCSDTGGSGILGLGITAFTVAGPGSGYSYAAPSNGLVTTARVRIGNINACPGDVPIAQTSGVWFVSLRPSAASGGYEISAISGPYTVSQNSVNQFYGVNLPMQQGEILSTALVDVAVMSSFWTAGGSQDATYAASFDLPVQTGSLSTSVFPMVGPGNQSQRTVINGDFEATPVASPESPSPSDTTPPELKFTRPKYRKDGKTNSYRRTIKKVKFNYSSDTTRAEIAIRRDIKRRSKTSKRRTYCSILKKNAKKMRFSTAKHSNCKLDGIQSQWWQTTKLAGNGKGFMKLKGRLHRGSYVAFLRGTDNSGNVTSTYVKGENRVAFRVL